jgi:hypothetical protein
MLRIKHVFRDYNYPYRALLKLKTMKIKIIANFSFGFKMVKRWNNKEVKEYLCFDFTPIYLPVSKDIKYLLRPWKGIRVMFEFIAEPISNEEFIVLEQQYNLEKGE